ncbi:hypothetical protein CRUP_025493 [Coryphaenoides rupestris]|nr:hypothetical protein CRUP_025493 [Coryphaenoides rupestris]
MGKEGRKGGRNYGRGKEDSSGRLTLEEEEEAVGVAGAEGREAQLCVLWEAEEDERVGEAVREPGLERRPRERKAARPCDTPSGRMNFSLSSRLGSFLTRNSSRAIQPPPTLTMTVLRRIRTKRSCWESPNCTIVSQLSEREPNLYEMRWSYWSRSGES